MPTQLKLFSASGSGSFSTLEKEINDWLAARGDNIQPVNSQTATCAIGSENSGRSQAVVIALWYRDPPEGHHH